MDSGNTFQNVMSEQCLQKIGFTLKDVKPMIGTLKTAKEGAKITLIGKLKRKIPLKFHGFSKTFFSAMVIVKNLTMDFNISGPFLKSNNIDQIHSKNCLQLGYETFSLFQPPTSISNLSSFTNIASLNTDNLSPVYLARDTLIPSNSVMSGVWFGVNVNCTRVQQFLLEKGCGIMNIGPCFKAKYDIDGMDGLTETDECGQAVVLLANTSSSEMKIGEGTYVGSFESLGYAPSFATRNVNKKPKIDMESQDVAKKSKTEVESKDDSSKNPHTDVVGCPSS